MFFKRVQGSQPNRQNILARKWLWKLGLSPYYCEPFACNYAPKSFSILNSWILKFWTTLGITCVPNPPFQMADDVPAAKLKAA